MPLQREVDSVSLIISTTNLSEDMSTLSSNDDELALLLYSYTDSIISGPPLFSTFFVLNKSAMTDTLYFKDRKQVWHKDLLLFLVEVDTERNVETIELQIRKNYGSLIKAYREKNYSEIETYLLDDDLLGVKIIKDFNRETLITIMDIYRADRYSYQIKLK